ncbi:kelch-like protein 10 isoform X2 [Zootermopsis nevadensis]|uniref:Kelch-like protein diablo n=2 Tax=Zootermopsis nevadensis TaxID=136037 RepID=A0A067RFK3_ZOONE|nr:kelch-like protein 10 isoform X2 [Zootermopsis nevadensis]KDR22542.1 Kelch-like protein 10 [Zootermopsis nevadensis]
MELNQSRTEAFVRLNKLRERNFLCDAVLRSEDGGVFPVHRVILSMSSEYFRALFTTTLHTGEATNILLHGISSVVMTQILDYVYFREVDIRSDNACKLLVAADYLCIPDIIKLCCDYLMDAKDTIDADNCFGILRVARLHSFADLKTHARSFVLRHFVELSRQSEELLELPVEELQAIIESEELNVKDEKVVWECILRWINRHPDSRKGQIAGLLKGVRLGLLDETFLKEEVSKHPYVTGNKACKAVISETLTFLDDVKSLTKKYKEFITPRIAYPQIPQDVLFAIGGYRDGTMTDVIEAYDARADRWTVVEGVDSIGRRAHHRTAVVGFDIYVVGGCNGEEVLSSCFCFNAVTKTCREVAPMHECRYKLSVAVLRGSVYAMGGVACRVIHRTAEIYDRKSNQWSMIAPMNTGRICASAAALNDKIYVAGGCVNLFSPLNSVEVYDPDTNRWTFVAPMLSRRASFSCVEYHGCLYALGGFNETSGVIRTEKYDAAEDTWIKIPYMNFYARGLNTEAIDDMIFVISGYYNGTDFVSHVACFHDKENRWYQLAEMNVCRNFLSTCVIKNLPNASDYAYKHREKMMEEQTKKRRRSNVQEEGGEMLTRRRRIVKEC